MNSMHHSVLLLSLFSLGCDGENTVKVVNTAPNVTILTPDENTQFVVSEDTVTFEARVDDAQQSSDSLEIRWTSDVDGVLNEEPAAATGEVGFSTVNLTLGTHLITLKAIDDKAEVGEDTVVIQIIEPIPETEDEEGKEGFAFCSGGGVVSNGSVSGAFCFAPMDIGVGSQSTTGDITWQPGPFVKISP